MTAATEHPEPIDPPTMTGGTDAHHDVPSAGRHVAEAPATDAHQAAERPPVTVPADALQTFNLKEAAELAGVSVSTMRRRRGELAKLGATVTEDGIWSIPITALEAAGLLDTTHPEAAEETEPVEQQPVEQSEAPQAATGSPSQAPGVAQGHPDAPDASERLRAVEAELAETRERLAAEERQRVEERHRAELAEVRQAAAEQRARAAEVLAEERRQTLEVERRMLTAGPSIYAPSWPSSASSPAEHPATPEDVEPEPAPQQEAPRLADTAAPESPVQQSVAEQPAPAPMGHDGQPRRRWRDWFGL